MKKVVYSAFLMAGVLLGSCSQSDTPLDGVGVVRVDLSTDFSFDGSATSTKSTRAINESDYTNIGNYDLKLVRNSDGTVIKEGLYSSWPLEMELESGASYTMTASYGQEEAASFDHLLVTGSETFTLNPGTTKNISFQCKPTAAKVSVNYDSSFDTYYSDCEVSVKTKHMSEAVTLSKKNAGQDLFVKADAAGEEVTLAFVLKDKYGEVATPEGFATSKTVTIKPQTSLKITVKPDVTEIEGGKFGIDVIVDSGVTEENVNIVVPNDIIK